MTHVSGNPTDAAGETVRVEAFGVSEEYSGVRRILADTGDGNDNITLDSSVLAPCNLTAGSGHDILIAGAGAAVLFGGSGGSTLVGSPQADTIIGGPGNDMIKGGGGDDNIMGGGGSNTIDGTGGSVTVWEQGDNNFAPNSNSLSYVNSVSLAVVGSDKLTSVSKVILLGGSSSNTFSVSRSLSNITLVGEGGYDQYSIALNGTGKVQYSIGDAAGNADSLLVKATPYRDVIGLDIDHVNVRTEDVTYFGIDHLTVDAGAANDEVDVRATVASTPVDLLGGSGNDLFKVSALAGTTSPLGTLLTIQGQLTIDAGSGSGNRIDVNNVGGNATPLIVMQDDGNGYMSIRNIAPAPIRYKATGGAFFEFLNGSAPLGYEADAGITVRRIKFAVRQILGFEHHRNGHYDDAGLGGE